MLNILFPSYFMEGFGYGFFLEYFTIKVQYNTIFGQKSLTLTEFLCFAKIRDLHETLSYLNVHSSFFNLMLSSRSSK